MRERALKARFWLLLLPITTVISSTIQYMYTHMFFSKNKDVNYFGAYYHPTYEDYEHAILLCYFLENKEDVKNIDYTKKEEITNFQINWWDLL